MLIINSIAKEQTIIVRLLLINSISLRIFVLSENSNVYKCRNRKEQMFKSNNCYIIRYKNSKFIFYIYIDEGP
jgi:plasmid replication initiation protein